MESVELILKIFPAPEQASRILTEVQNFAQENDFRLINAAGLSRNLKGETWLDETGDIKTGWGAIVGAITGGLLGLLGGPLGAVVGAASGAAAGSVALSRLDFGFADEFLEKINQALAPGTSAILVLVDAKWADMVVMKLNQAPGKIFRHALRSQLVDQIKESMKSDAGRTAED